MNLLDENVVETQCRLLRKWRIPFRQIGDAVGRQGMKDSEIIPLLHGLASPTFFTRDDDFYDRRLCHASYCLAHCAVGKNEVAVFVRRFLRHPRFNTKGKRVGCVVRLSHAGLVVWSCDTAKSERLAWPGRA